MEDDDDELTHQSKKLKTKQFRTRAPTPYPSFASEDSLDTSFESNIEEENFQISTIKEDSGNDEDSGDSPCSLAAEEDDIPSDPISEDESDSGEIDEKEVVKETLQLKSPNIEKEKESAVNPLEFQKKLSLN